MQWNLQKISYNKKMRTIKCPKCGKEYISDYSFHICEKEEKGKIVVKNVSGGVGWIIAFVLYTLAGWIFYLAFLAE